MSIEASDIKTTLYSLIFSASENISPEQKELLSEISSSQNWDADKNNVSRELVLALINFVGNFLDFGGLFNKMKIPNTSSDKFGLVEIREKVKSEQRDEDNYIKGIPYMGWYWREINVDGPSMITHAPDGVAICQNDKWGYPMKELSFSDEVEIAKLCADFIVKIQSATSKAELERILSSNVTFLYPFFDKLKDKYFKGIAPRSMIDD